jgi:hypothetical protein
MRFADVSCFVVLVALAAGLVVAANQSAPPVEHSPAPQTFHGPLAHPLVQELPDSLVNGPAERSAGPDGFPLVDHSAGW